MRPHPDAEPCPRCGSREAVREIVYGDPNPDDFEAAERGELVLSVNSIDGEPGPRWDCARCGCRFGEVPNSGGL